MNLKCVAANRAKIIRDQFFGTKKKRIHKYYINTYRNLEVPNKNNFI